MTPPNPQDSREDEFLKDEWRVEMKSERVKTREQFLKACDYDKDLWKLDSLKGRSYEVTCVPRSTRKSDKEKWIRPSSQPVTIPMWAWSATFKKRREVEKARDVLALVKKDFSSLFPARLIPPPPVNKALTGNVLELNISDHHFGKLAWGKETNDRDWDLGIAKKSWRHAVGFVLAHSQHLVWDEVILVVGNDVAQIDTMESTTSSGTRVDSDSRYPKVYVAVLAELRWTVCTLRATGVRVRVVVIPGNHDTVSCFTLGVALEIAFENDPGVVVDNEPCPRKAYAFGKVLLGWEHGHCGKLKQRPLNLAVEYPDLWGSTEFREIHTGHVHHTVVEDVQSVIVRQVSCLGPNDAWHHKNGYLALRNVEAFYWNSETGLFGTCSYTAPSGRKLLSRSA